MKITNVLSPLNGHCRNDLLDFWLIRNDGTGTGDMFIFTNTATKKPNLVVTTVKNMCLM